VRDVPKIKIPAKAQLVVSKIRDKWVAMLRIYVCTSLVETGCGCGAEEGAEGLPLYLNLATCLNACSPITNGVLKT
jgi:hypothetical protein